MNNHLKTCKFKTQHFVNARYCCFLLQLLIFFISVSSVIIQCFHISSYSSSHQFACSRTHCLITVTETTSCAFKIFQGSTSSTFFSLFFWEVANVNQSLAVGRKGGRRGKCGRRGGEKEIVCISPDTQTHKKKRNRSKTYY